MPTTTRRLAAVAAALAGVLHLFLVPEYLAAVPWLGVSFLATVAVSGWVSSRLWLDEDPAAWGMGAMLTSGVVVGFGLSRTVGLFGYLSPDLAEGIPVLVVETAFVVPLAHHLATTPRRAGAVRS